MGHSLFRKDHTKESVLSMSEKAYLLEQMQQVAKGDCTSIDASKLADQELAEGINAMIKALNSNCNDYVLRLNDAMDEATNNTVISQMLKTVSDQTTAIDGMRNSSEELGNSITSISNVVEEIKKFVDDAVKVSATSVANMTNSIQVVNESSKDMEKLTELIGDFKTKTSKINEIVDIVKSVAQQSNLLALNASIEAARAGEAGRGFAVVAGEVKTLSDSTTSSAGDINHYVEEIQAGIEELTSSIQGTADKLKNGNTIVETSVKDIQTINKQMNTINEEITTIYAYVQNQTAATEEFVSSIDQMADSYDELQDDCNQAGEFLFNTIRNTDKIRGTIAKKAVELKVSDKLRIFEVDHIIYTWRLNNAVGGYETLNANTLANDKGCKLGKWMESVAGEPIAQKAAFQEMKRHHSRLHAKSVQCFEEINKKNKEKAIQYYQEAKQILDELLKELEILRGQC